MVVKRVWTRRILSHTIVTGLTERQVSVAVDAWLSSGHWVVQNRLWSWDVAEASESARVIRLSSRVPGIGGVVFRWTPGNASRLTCHLRFDPYGVVGFLYWMAVWPVHWVGLRAMLYLMVRTQRRADCVG